MKKRYYLDTSIWMDIYEDRIGYNGEPLGDYAIKLFAMIKAKSHTLVLSDLLVRELESNYSIEEINGMVLPFKKITEKILVIANCKNLQTFYLQFAILANLANV